MITIGVDFSKRNSHYCVLDEKGQRMKRCKLENSREAIQEFFEELPDEPKQLAMEATRNWGLYHDTVRPYVDIFHLGHPVKMEAITKSETKNDQNDAELIARLTFSRFLPQAHVSLLDTRQLRSLLRFRHFLVKERTALRNQVHILVDRNLWPCDRPQSFKDIFSQRGIRWLNSLELPSRERFILDRCLNGYAHLSGQIVEFEYFINSQGHDLKGMECLRTVPGFKKSKVNLYTVLLEIDDISRFNKARHLAHYAGLVPKENSSGDKHRTGRLVKQANKFLRTAILESVFGALRTDKGLRAYYQTVKDRAGSGAAVIASSRKLCYAIYHVLKEQRAYKPFASLPPAAVRGL
jgi:transposase